MPGNEKDVIKFLFENKNKINLNHFKSIRSIKIPYGNELYELNLKNFNDFFSDDARKKADVFINDKGCSIKEEESFLFNRLQRKDISEFFGNFFKKEAIKKMIVSLDKKVKDIHIGVSKDRHGKIKRHKQNFNYEEIMTELEFKELLIFLMFEGSPNYGKTKAPAEFIIEAKKKIESPNDLVVYSFEDYFEKNKKEITFRFRSSRFGQESKTEHNRAKGMLKYKENLPWCFNTIVGKPKAWRQDIDEKDRKQVYYLMIEKVKKKNKKK